MSTGPVRPGGFVVLLASALASAGITTAFVLAGDTLRAGVAAVLSGLALMGARWRLPRWPRLALVEAVAERVVEAAILGAIAWMALPAEPRLAGAAILALGGSYLVAYVRVRAAGLEFGVSDVPWFRPVFWLAVAGGLLAGWAEVGLWGAAALSAVALAVELAELGARREPG